MDEKQIKISADSLVFASSVLQLTIERAMPERERAAL